MKPTRRLAPVTATVPERSDQPVGARFAWRGVAPRYGVVLLYALAMAYVESASVLYLRTIYGGVDPVGPRNTPFTVLPDFNGIEIGREFATVVMLACVGYLAGGGTGGRVGAFLGAFGLWDIGYYLFLQLFSGWPPSLLAPDILFLIPLPWWGPVVAPMLLAALMVAWGGLALARERGDGFPAPTPRFVAIALVGVVVCLVAFMFDALQALGGGGGLSAAFSVRGGDFPWPLFLLGVALMAAGAVGLVGGPATGEPLNAARAARGR